MRRHPLTGRLIRAAQRAVVAVALGAAVAACSTAAADQTLTVTVATAPGTTLAYRPADQSVAAGVPIRLLFRNESGVPHNLVFTAGVTASTRTIVEPGTSDELQLGKVAAGTYRFACTIHDGMAGTLVVAGPNAVTDGATGSPSGP